MARTHPLEHYVNDGVTQADNHLPTSKRILATAKIGNLYLLVFGNMDFMGRSIFGLVNFRQDFEL